MLLLVLGGVAYRIFLLDLPSYRHVFYDEAIPGLMALEILDGKFSTFYWAHPYLGSLDAILAAGVFALIGPSTWALRVSVLLAFAVYAVLLYKLTQKITGKRFPFYICLYLAFPPLALSEFSLSTIGGYIHTVAMGTGLMLITVHLLGKAEPERQWGWWLGWGFLAGIGFWTFIMIAPYIAACGLVLVLKMGRRYFGKPLVYSLGAFVLGSAPLWIWNLKNNFLTFKMRTQTAQSGALGDHLANLFQLLCDLLGRTHEYARSPWADTLTWLSALLLLLLLIFWATRYGARFLRAVILRRTPPSALDLVVITFVFFAASYVISNKGQYILVRYGLPLYSALPVLMALCFHQMADARKWLHLIFIPLLLLMHTPYNWSYIRNSAAYPSSDQLPALLDFLKQEAIDRAYAHYTVAHPITFESGGAVICSDFGGFRNLDYLKAVDQAPRAAIITNTAHPNPQPHHMAQTLKLLTTRYKQKTIGKYTVFYDFQIDPDGHRQEITRHIKAITLSPAVAPAAHLLDRHFATAWQTRQGHGPRNEIHIELATPQAISKISLLPGFNVRGFPSSLLLETSMDGRLWRQVRHVAHIADAFLAFNGNPRISGNGQIDIYLPGETARFIRLRPLVAHPRKPWSVAELFLFGPGAQHQTNSWDLQRQTLATVLAHPIQGSVVSYPWVISYLDHRHGEIDLAAAPYPPHQVYRSLYHKGDFEQRRLNYSRPYSFVVYRTQAQAVCDHLAAKQITHRQTNFRSWALIATDPVPKLRQAFDLLVPQATHPLDPAFIPAPGIPVSPPQLAVQVEMPGNQPMDGIRITTENPTIMVLDARIQASDDGRTWKPVSAVNYQNSYWSHSQLLYLNGPAHRWYFPRTITSRYLAVEVITEPGTAPSGVISIRPFKIR